MSDHGNAAVSRATLAVLAIAGALLLVIAYVAYGYEWRWVRQLAIGGLVMLGAALILAVQRYRGRR